MAHSWSYNDFYSWCTNHTDIDHFISGDILFNDFLLERYPKDIGNRKEFIFTNSSHKDTAQFMNIESVDSNPTIFPNGLHVYHLKPPHTDVTIKRFYLIFPTQKTNGFDSIMVANHYSFLVDINNGNRIDAHLTLYQPRTDFEIHT